jgi:exopolysaccharide production protein ExoZ
MVIAPREDRQPEIIQSHYLDVLRGVAALIVMVAHADHAGLMQIPMGTSVKVFLGRFGVYLFFILSGFLIWRSAQGIRRVGGLMTYGIHRVTRLVPLYLVNIAFVVWALPHFDSAFQAQVTPEALVRHLTFTQGLNPSASRYLNPVLWTLTHEVIFYALVPLLLMLPAAFLPLLGGLAIVLSWTPSTVSTFLALFHLFTIGILVAERRIVWAGLALLVFTAMQATGQPYAAEEITARLAAGGLFMVALVAPVRGRWLSAPLRWVGIVSFSLYIWHYLFINILGTQTGLRALHTVSFGWSANDWIRGVLFVAMALGISAVSYHLIERPDMGPLRRWLMARLVPPGVRPSPVHKA